MVCSGGVDWEKEVGLCFLASGTSSERGTRQIGPLLQQPYHGRLVAICDVSKEGTQAGLTGCLIRLCHCYRLPEPIRERDKERAADGLGPLAETLISATPTLAFGPRAA